jgi:ABC-type transport system substrate-binding protein
MDMKTREQIYAEIQELAIEDCPFIGLSYGHLGAALSKKVEG